MLRPCRCRGSLAWVHLDCLNSWRNNSANPKSFYQCDQCAYEYRFGDKAFAVAKLLGQRGVAHALTIASLLVAIWVAGFVARPFGVEVPTVGLNLGRLDHWAKGSVVVAIVSLATSPFSGVRQHAIFNPILGRPRFATLRTSSRKSLSKLDSILFGIDVLVGLCVAIYAIYCALVLASTRLAKRGQRIVLDAHIDRQDDHHDRQAREESNNNQSIGDVSCNTQPSAPEACR